MNSNLPLWRQDTSVGEDSDLTRGLQKCLPGRKTEQIKL